MQNGTPLVPSERLGAVAGAAGLRSRLSARLRLLLAVLAALAALAAAPGVGATPSSEVPAESATSAEATDPGQQTNVSSSEAAVENASEAGQVAEQSIEGSEATEGAPTGDDADPAETGSGDSSGESEPESQSQNAESESSVSQNAGAQAEANQSDPANVSVTVAVDQGGDQGGVSQQNDVSAGAQSSAGADVPGAGSSTSQSASAQASANQSGADNVNVTVLVDSPGNTGPVNQANNASANAQASATSTDPAASQSASAGASASQENPSNTNVSIRVDSPGGNGPVNQGNTASATADAQTTSPDGDAEAQADASQTGALNTNVSVRVDSPGADGPVEQTNTTIETAAGDVSVETGGGNINVTVEIETGIDHEVPDDWVWTWTWSWDFVSEADLEAFLAGFDPEDPWAWVWSNDPNAGMSTKTTDTAASVAEPETVESDESQNAGTWTWVWEWETDVEGWDWSWSWTGEAPCECTWNWTWSWSWTNVDTESDGSADGATEATDATVEQTNSATAVATAEAEAVVEQDIEQLQSGDSARLQDALQSTDVLQTVTADAAVVQDATLNLTIALGGLVSQLNGVAAASASSASSESLQLIAQEQQGDGSEQAQWAGQVVAIVQVASSQSLATQELVANWNHSGGSEIVQENASSAGATTALDSTLVQVILQYQTGNGSIQSQDAGQIATVAQDHAALAWAAQSEAINSNLSVGGGFDQGNLSQAGAESDATSTGAQLIAQAAAGDGEIDLQEAWQVLEVVQGGVAVATASQSDVSNENVSFAPPAEQPTAPTAPGRPSPGLGAGTPPLAEAYWSSVSVWPGPTELSPTVLDLPVVDGGVASAGAPPPELALGLGGVASAATYQVSTSRADEGPAPATRGPSYGGRLAVDVVPEEDTAPPPGFAPSESGAIAGWSQGTSSSGPAATAARLTLHVPEVTTWPSSPAVRRPAAIGFALEHPG